MEITSDRWAKWMQPQWDNMDTARPETVEVAEQPKYVLWVNGGRALYDGEMMGLTKLDFVDGESSFQIKVDNPGEAKRIINKISGCVMLGLVELDDDDGEYHEWYSEYGLAIDEDEYGN